MAGEKLSPRQRMINLMYLVLIALLALNVSREVINSFITVNDGLEESNDVSQLRNLAIYQDLKMAYNVDSLKAGKFYREAGTIVEESKELRTYIVKLKKKLIAETEGLEPEVADTIHLSRVKLSDSYNESTNIMIGNSEDGSDGSSKELRDKIQGYMDKVNSGLQELGLTAIEAGIDFSPKQSQAGILNWEMNNFYLAPLAGSVTILSKLENDVNRFEYLALARLLGEIDSDDIPIDTVAAKVLPQSNYILMGENYKANIILSAYSTTQEPIVELGEYNSNGTFIVKETLDTEAGQGVLSFQTSREGLQSYEGRITIYDKEGNPMYYPFESEYLVARPSAVVSPTKMNVFYKGLDNPVSVSVPGIPADKLQVSISGGNKIIKQSNGQYLANIKASSTGEVTVNVSAEVDGKIKPMGKMNFRVKNLPEPKAYVNGKNGSLKMRKGEIKTIQGVNVVYDKSFPYNIPISAKKFKMTYYGRSGNSSTIPVNGKRLDRKMQDVVNNVRSGDRVEFHGIVAEGRDGIPYKLPAIMITVL